jgi:hypothetical protein
MGRYGRRRGRRGQRSTRSDYCPNCAAQAGLKLAFCRRRHAVMARTLGIFAGTETIDVGGAGAALLGSPLVLRECRSGCKQREE